MDIKHTIKLIHTINFRFRTVNIKLTFVSKSAKLAKSAKLSLFVVFAVLLSPQPPAKGSLEPGFELLLGLMLGLLVGLLLELI